MTDERFKQLMDKLEEIRRALPQPRYVGHPGSIGIGQCLNCGGFHGLGLMCPRLVPSTISHTGGTAP